MASQGLQNVFQPQDPRTATPSPRAPTLLSYLDQVLWVGTEGVSLHLSWGCRIRIGSRYEGGSWQPEEVSDLDESHGRSNVSAQPSSRPCFSWSAFPRLFPCLRRSTVLWDQYSALRGKLPTRENTLFFPERSLETRPSRSLWVSKVVSGKSWLDSRHTEGFPRAPCYGLWPLFCKHWSPAGIPAAPLMPGFRVKPSSPPPPSRSS